MKENVECTLYYVSVKSRNNFFIFHPDSCYLYNTYRNVHVYFKAILLTTFWVIMIITEIGAIVPTKLGQLTRAEETIILLKYVVMLLSINFIFFFINFFG